MLFAVWSGNVYRPTRDLDLLGMDESSAEHLVKVFRSLCNLSVDHDGIVFNADSVRSEEIRNNQVYEGQRVKLIALLGKAVLSLQVDIGFGDAVTPAAKRITYPTLLGHSAPVIMSYPPETVVAEKLETMVSLGIGNSRMKDFYDVWVLLGDFELSNGVLRDAFRATFNRRGTVFPETTPIALSDEFAFDVTKQKQWRAFVDRSGLPSDVVLSEVVVMIRQRLWPLLESLG